VGGDVDEERAVVADDGVVVALRERGRDDALVGALGDDERQDAGPEDGHLERGAHDGREVEELGVELERAERAARDDDGAEPLDDGPQRERRVEAAQVEARLGHARRAAAQGVDDDAEAVAVRRDERREVGDVLERGDRLDVRAERAEELVEARVEELERLRVERRGRLEVEEEGRGRLDADRVARELAPEVRDQDAEQAQKVLRAPHVPRHGLGEELVGQHGRRADRRLVGRGRRARRQVGHEARVPNFPIFERGFSARDAAGGDSSRTRAASWTRTSSTRRDRRCTHRCAASSLRPSSSTDIASMQMLSMLWPSSKTTTLSFSSSRVTRPATLGSSMYLRSRGLDPRSSEKGRRRKRDW